MTAEERLIKEARENLMKQARDCEKIEFLLAIALTSAAMTTMFVGDLRRIKDVIKTEKERKDVRMLRKDLELADQMKRAMKNIGDYLTKIDSQYRMYIQSHLDRIFQKEGIPYNVKHMTTSSLMPVSSAPSSLRWREWRTTMRAI